VQIPVRVINGCDYLQRTLWCGIVRDPHRMPLTGICTARFDINYRSLEIRLKIKFYPTVNHTLYGVPFQLIETKSDDSNIALTKFE